MNLVPIERKQSEEDLQQGGVVLREGARGGPRLRDWRPITSARCISCCSNYDEAVKYFKRAIEIDPDARRVARTECAAVLIEQGDADEAIRQLTEVLRLDADERRGATRCWRAPTGTRARGAQAIDAADKALALKPRTRRRILEGRRAAPAGRGREGSPKRCSSSDADARDDYRAFLDLTNFSTRPRGRSWRSSSSASASAAASTPIGRARTTACAAPGSSGCACRSTRSAIRCARASTASAALQHAPNDPIAYFLLGNVNRDLYNAQPVVRRTSVAARTATRR